MAVAGLHNVSMLDSSFLRESQSPVPRQCSNQDRTSTREPSLLQMWRELESEHVTSRPQPTYEERTSINGSNIDFDTNYSLENQRSVDQDCIEDADTVDNGCQTCPQTGAQIDNEDSNSSNSDLSADLGEVERERVRQIFQEWMNSGAKGHTTNASCTNNCSRAQWLGENERERVRIIREWVQMTSQQKGSCASLQEEQATDVGSRIEQVRNGLAINPSEIGAPKDIRRLCGRQALLDLLMKAEKERKKELHHLQENRPVSGFGHRNRIQALLRGRFLRNEPMQSDKPISVAESELGILRQKHTVSGLKEEFLSRLDIFVSGSVSIAPSEATSSIHINVHGNDQSQPNDEPAVINEICDLSEASPREREMSLFHTDDHQSCTHQCANRHDSTLEEEIQEQVKEDEEREQGVSSIIMGVDSRDISDSENEERDQFPSSIAEHVCRRYDLGNYVDGNLQGSIVIEQSEEISSNEDSGQGNMLEAQEDFHEHFSPPSETRDLREISVYSNASERNTVERFDQEDTSAQLEWQELIPGNEESEWQQLDSVEFNEWNDSTGENGTGNWPQDADNQWYEEASVNDVENNYMQESRDEWHESHLQAALDNWLDGNSSQEASPVRRVNAFHFSDDDNVYNMELRELSRRRRVSNLLQSGFRENLDQLIHSYVERQAHASADWDAEERSPSPASLEQDQEQQTGVQNVSQSDSIEETSLVLPSQPATIAEPLWNHGLHDANWPHPYMHQQSGIEREWNVINELRIDVAQLQQRMNNMQRMLEACMDMQLELQRAVRQEVSAALNRSDGPSDSWGASMQMDESKFDHVGKGVCCVCCDGNIDSLLYRCGHMCTCSKCAETLVKGKGKCPMCWAPVVEVIRAYSIQ